MRRHSAFTLIELITAIAISAILLTIIAVPVVQGFNLTRAAQSFSQAQDRARTLVRQLEREVGNAASVRDNNAERGAIDVVVPGRDRTPVVVRLPFAKLDLVRPAEGDPQDRGPGGAFRNPDTGRFDPTLRAPKGQQQLPARQGSTLVRYFVGLREPLVLGNDGSPAGAARYTNPYDGLLMARSGERDNLYVLFRAEVQPRVWRTVNGRLQPVVDTGLFLDDDLDGTPDDLDDPAFFTLLPGQDFNVANSALTAVGRGKAVRMQNWLRRATVVTEVSRFDMVAPVVEKTSPPRVQYDGNVPRLVSLVRFQPKRVTSEAVPGELAVRTGEEAFNTDKVGPDVFTTQYGAWANVNYRVWPSLWPPAFGENLARAGDVRGEWGGGPYLVGRAWTLAGVERVGLFGFDPATMSDDEREGVEVFDVSRYLEVLRLPKDTPGRPYAFTAAVASADSRTNWLQDPRWLVNFVPVVPDPRGGKLVGSFPINEVGTDASLAYDLRVPTRGQQSAAGAPNVADRVGVRVSPYDPNTPLDFTPNNDPDVGTGVWSDERFQPVNRTFNKLWTDFPRLAPGLDRATYVRRFIDLRAVPQADGSLSPLLPAADPADVVARAVLTPGSEVVVGPDQRPGPNYGRYVRYTRVTQRPVGPNQYLINYTDQPEPRWSELGLPYTIGDLRYDPRAYRADEFFQAVLQAPYRAGYVELNSRFGEPIPSGFRGPNGFVPTGNIYVSYRFQYTEPKDVVAVDYDTTQVVEFTVTIRNFPQSQNLPNPQNITVRGAAEARNFVR